MRARLIAVLYVFVAPLGCSSDDIPAAAPAGPKLLIISPKDGDHVVVTPEMDNGQLVLETKLVLSVQNFTLRKPGLCGGAGSCGHVHVHVDGDSCNDTAPNGTRLPYNEEAFALMVPADFLHCDGAVVGPTGVMGVDGEHVISAAFYDDAEAAVVDAAGKPLADSAKVTVEVQDGGGGAGGTGGAAGAGGNAGASAGGGAAGTGGA